MGIGADPILWRWMADTVLTLKPKMIESGYADAARLDEHLADRFHEAACRLNAQLVGPAQVCAWTELN
jgi:hypothetical protein